jgi:CHAD domain-containing protein
MQEQAERELKYDVPEGWELPDVSGLAPDDASVEVETVRLHSAYFDTADRDLLRHGITLRRRTGDTDTGWHLKVPAGDARTELRLPADGDAVPGELRDLVRGVVDGAELRNIATLDTERTITKLVAADGGVLAEIDDDNVTALAVGDAAVVQKWREVEIELGDADEQFLETSARWLVAAGAVPSESRSKLARAVGDPSPGQPPPEGSLAALVSRYLREQHRAMVRGDIELRRGADLVHKTRVATRRFRSVLRVFDLFDPERAARLDAELKWYADALGRERDLQVMRRHLLEAVEELPDEVREATADRLAARFESDERAARQELLEVLESDRYRAMLATVRAFVEDAPDGSDRPAKKVRRYVRAAHRKAAKRLASAAVPPQSDERTHRARKAAKRARYTAELATPALGNQAADRAGRQEDVQDELGELQDAIVAAGYLKRISDFADGPAGFGLGVLWQGELDRAERVRAKLAEGRPTG